MVGSSRMSTPVNPPPLLDPCGQLLEFNAGILHRYMNDGAFRHGSIPNRHESSERRHPRYDLFCVLDVDVEKRLPARVLHGESRDVFPAHRWVPTHMQAMPVASEGRPSNQKVAPGIKGTEPKERQD